ncbi:TRAP transporter permease [Bacteroidota bacterium]
MTLGSLKEVQTSTTDTVPGQARRAFTGQAGRILWLINVLFGTYIVLTFSGFFQAIGIFIFPLRYDAIFLMYILVMTYMYVPATKHSLSNRLPWYDITAILLSIMVCGYIVYMATELPKRLYLESSPLERTFGLIAIALVIEGVRRTIGPILAVLGILFFIYPFVSNHLPGFLYSAPLGLDRVIQFQYVYPYGLFGNLLHIFSSIVAPFLIFGAFLVGSGAGEWLIQLATGMMGRYRGGPAKIAVLASGFFGSISGSPTANVCTTGAITIPMMKRLGYKPHFAAAVEAVASEGGQIMPPVLGAAAFIMMDFLGESYLTIIIAALIPALLYYLALFLMLDLEAAKLGLEGLPRKDLPSVKATTMAGWPYLIPIAVLLIFIGPLHFSPQTACTWAIAAIIACSWLIKGKGMGPKKIADGLADGVTKLPNVCIIMEIAALLVGIFELTGLGLRITSGLIAIAGGNTLLLLIMAGFGAMLLGTGMPTSGVYLMTAILVAPALMSVGIPPIAAHFYGWYYGLAAALTPPVCITSFLAAGIAGAPYMRTGIQGVRLGIVIFLVPIMFAYSPELLMIGTPGDIALAVITAIIGVVLLSFGVQGYLLKSTNWLQRIMLLVGGIAMMVSNLTADLAGIGIGLAAILWHWGAIRLAAKSSQTQP